MDVTPLIKDGALIIQSYSDGKIRINDQQHKTPLLVFPDEVKKWTIPNDFENMKEADFTPLIEIANDIDVVLLGCGKEIKFLHPALKKSLRHKNLHIETMDTGAACRTYNVLLAEGRRVVVGFLS